MEDANNADHYRTPEDIAELTMEVGLGAGAVVGVGTVFRRVVFVAGVPLVDTRSR